MCLADAHLAGSELLGHRLAHLPAAFLQRLDSPLLGCHGCGFGGLAQCLPCVAHGGVGIGQTGRHFPGQVAELLHQLAKRAAQSLLHPLIGLALGISIAGLGFRRTILAALLGMIQQAALASDHILHHAGLLFAALTLFGTLPGGFLRRLGVRRLAILQLVKHALQLGQLLFGVVHAAFLGRLARRLGHFFEVLGVHLHSLRIDLLLGAVALCLFQHHLQAVLDGFLQLLQLAVDLGKVGLVRFLGSLVQRIARRLTGVFQRPRGTIPLTILQLQREFPHALLG